MATYDTYLSFAHTMVNALQEKLVADHPSFTFCPTKLSSII